jgi:hypothetical protein
LANVSTRLRDRLTRGVLLSFGIAPPFSDADIKEPQRSELFAGAKAFVSSAGIAASGEPRLLYATFGADSAVTSALVGLGNDAKETDVLLSAVRDAEGRFAFALEDGDRDDIGTVDAGAATAHPSNERLVVGDLQRLVELKARGLLSDPEFEMAKRKLLS